MIGTPADTKTLKDRADYKLMTTTNGAQKDAQVTLFVDSLTLFLHGICCDIDVETGPRQLASRHMRKRLELLRGFYPPPKGYAVFPEDLKG